MSSLAVVPPVKVESLAVQAKLAGEGIPVALVVKVEQADLAERAGQSDPYTQVYTISFIFSANLTIVS